VRLYGLGYGRALVKAGEVAVGPAQARVKCAGEM